MKNRIFTATLLPVPFNSWIPILCMLILAACQAFGQTFVYQSSFTLTDTDGPNEFCLFIHDNKIFVQDEDGNEVDTYNENAPFDYLESFGQGHFNKADDGIVIFNGLIFVVDDDEDVIEVFNASNFNFETQIDISGYVDDIEGILMADDRLFVVDYTGGINVFNAHNPYAFITEFGDDQLVSPSGIATNGINLYVVDEETDDIHVFDAKSYSYLASFGKGSQYGEGLATICDYILVLEDDFSGNGDNEIEDNFVDVYQAYSPYSHVTSFGINEITDSECIAVSGNLIYIGDSITDEIDIFQLIEGCDPIPTVAQWGLINLGFLLLIFGTAALNLKSKLIIQNPDGGL